MGSGKRERAGRFDPSAEDSGERSLQPTLAGDGCVVRAPAHSIVGTVSLTEATVPSESIAKHLGRTDRYLPMGELGRGGMGLVTALFDRVLGRSVASKTVLDPRFAALLLREARVCAQLEHPSIVPLYDIDADEAGNPRYTMRVLHGRTLRDVLDVQIEPGRRSLVQQLGILRQICLAVDCAHSRGVVHRDLKPENVIVGEFGEVYVLDWGVAHVMPDNRLNGSFNEGSLHIAGSPGYMAPEQVLGEEITPRTDVFALGVMLYEVLTGEPPFHDVSLVSIVERASAASPPPPSRRPSCSTHDFDDLVRACLERDPELRPHSARQIAEAIDIYLEGERARLEKEREALRAVEEGDECLASSDAFHARALELRGNADVLLAGLKPHDPVETKLPAWEMQHQARRLDADAARSLAGAEAAFTRALGCVPDHKGARAGLAKLHYQQLIASEEANQHERMAHHLVLARAYDDGALRLELADAGVLEIESIPSATRVAIARYESKGPLLVEGSALDLGVAPVAATTLASGSYVITARIGDDSIRYPLVVERAKRHRLKLRGPREGEIPEGFVLIPGGPVLAQSLPSRHIVRRSMPDFAIGRFPITFRDYIEFWKSIDDPEERLRRLPRAHGEPLFHDTEGTFRPREAHVEGEARKRVEGRELELPITDVTWFDAIAFARWKSRQLGFDMRLPTDLEWEKAMRGADGRAFPMGHELDPAFAKLLRSRPEPSQPEPIGAFPLDESPYGVRDMAGGVGDWTSTADTGAPLDPLSEGASTDQRCAFYCGWHWANNAPGATFRIPVMLTQRHAAVGFRLAMSLDPEDSSDLVVEPMQ